MILTEEEDHKDLEIYQAQEELMHEFVEKLRVNVISCLVIDEAQKQHRLAVILMKSNLNYKFIFSDTPACGERTIDFGTSARFRSVPHIISTLRCYETSALLNSVFGENVSCKCWLDFWTIFNGEPSTYQKSAQFLNGSSETDINKSLLAQNGIDESNNEIMLPLCNNWLFYRRNWSK
jgi:hypothetical protein